MLSAMIVDDEAPARSELRYLLEQSGQVDSIVEASGAREAVQKLVLLEDEVDLALDVLDLASLQFLVGEGRRPVVIVG